MHAPSRHVRIALVLAALLAPAAPALAQHEARITGSLSSAFGDGGPAPSFAVAAAVPLVSRVRFELEGTFVRNLDFGQYYSCPPDRVCAAVVSFPFTLTGDAASLGGNVLVETPWRSRRVHPYVLGGLGFAHVRRESLETRFDRVTVLTKTSSTAPLLTAGGGVEFLIARRVTLGADARYQRMYEKDQFHRKDIKPNIDLVRIGSAIGYRF